MIETATQNADKIQFVAEVLKTIGHPIRLQIIELLDETESMSVAELQDALQIEQSLLSHHLTKMKSTGVLSSSRNGRNIYYQLKLNEVSKILDCMKNCEI